MVGLKKLLLERVDIDQPKFDMSTYVGRARHFFKLTNPLNLLASNARLERAKKIVTAYRRGVQVPYVTTLEEVWNEKYLYDSAFHPDTGEKMFLLGRMSAQLPSNTFLTGCMVVFYKPRSKMMFFQWLNQTFNAVVNHTNRSGKSTISPINLVQAYLMATFGALFTGAILKYATKSMPTIFARMVPFAAVAAANCVNLPLMRQNELKYGITLVDSRDNEVGLSRKAAVIGIAEVVLSRIAMAVPGMVFTPLLIENLEKRGFLARQSKWNAPIQVAFVSFTLIFSTPLGCALFRQKESIKVDELESHVCDDIRQKFPNLDVVYYNKGL